MNASSAIGKKNRTALVLLLLAVAAAFALLTLPAYTFTSSVYSLKSPKAAKTAMHVRP